MESITNRFTVEIPKIPVTEECRKADKVKEILIFSGVDAFTVTNIMVSIEEFKDESAIHAYHARLISCIDANLRANADYCTQICRDSESIHMRLSHEDTVQRRTLSIVLESGKLSACTSSDQLRVTPLSRRGLISPTSSQVIIHEGEGEGEKKEGHDEAMKREYNKKQTHFDGILAWITCFRLPKESTLTILSPERDVIGLK